MKIPKCSRLPRRINDLKNKKELRIKDDLKIEGVLESQENLKNEDDSKKEIEKYGDGLKSWSCWFEQNEQKY